jgi:hypothetical protein
MGLKSKTKVSYSIEDVEELIKDDLLARLQQSFQIGCPEAEARFKNMKVTFHSMMKSTDMAKKGAVVEFEDDEL